jgi:hypothetical protein
MEYFTMRRGLNLHGIGIIRRYIARNGIGLVHCHGYKPNIFLASLRHTEFKVISTAHGWSKTATSVRGRIYQYLDGIALRRMTKVVAVSTGRCRTTATMWNKTDRIQIERHRLNNGVVQSDRRLVREENGIGPDDFVLGCVGRLTK